MQLLTAGLQRCSSAWFKLSMSPEAKKSNTSLPVLAQRAAPRHCGALNHTNDLSACGQQAEVGHSQDMGTVTAALAGSAALPERRSLPQSVTHSHSFG